MKMCRTLTVLFIFILNWYYLSSQIALTGWIFVLYDPWPNYGLSGTWFMLKDG